MKNKNLISIMGVANVTPNSFSDGSLYNNKDLLKNHIQYLLQKGATIIDIGAESTAPFNEAISAEEEIERLKSVVIPVILELEEELISKSIRLSIDTYRYETIDFVIKEISKEHTIIWNDISGCFDEDVFNYLDIYPHFYYVYGHNLVTNRKDSNDHMNYVSELDILDQIEYWVQDFNKIKGIDFTKIYLDPCFGFSKSYEQNILLLENMNNFFKMHPKWMIGISKKSFLRKMVEKDLDSQKSFSKEKLLLESETIHKSYLKEWSKAFAGEELIYRVHHPEIFS
tara:strand:- start:12990 stop:13841 length:852 start_codon:yes stop_codon:yes gene_type:complete